MKKRELLQMKPLKVTEKMRRMVREDVKTRKTIRYGNHSHFVDVYQRYQYFRAVEENGILKVGVFERKSIAVGSRLPDFEIYIDRENEDWINYNASEGKWGKAKIDMLDYQNEEGEIYGNKPFIEEKDKKRINRYFGTNGKEPREAILEFQLKIRKEQLSRKHRRETDAIDDVMNKVPEIPKKFDAWVMKWGFYNHHYIFYQTKKKKEGWCSQCKTYVPLNGNQKHNEKGICPHCKMPVTLKCWGKQKAVLDTVTCGLMQKLNDGTGYVIREFECKIRRLRENGFEPDIAGCWELGREILDNDLNKNGIYGFDEYKNTGVERWCKGRRKQSWYGYYTDFSLNDMVMYPSNLNQVLKDSNLKYMPVKEIVSSKPGERCDFTALIKNLVRNQKMEYLAKAGLKKLVFDMQGDYHGGFAGMINTEAKKPWELIRVEKEQFKMICRMNAGTTEIRIIQRGNRAGIRFTEKQIAWMAKYIGASEIIMYMNYATPHRFIRYMREKLDVEHRRERARDYYDYLEECQKLDFPMDEQTLFPQNFDRAHEMTSEAVREMKNEESSVDRKIQEEAFRKSQMEKESLYKYEDETFLLKLPMKEAEFRDEGRQQHNCVRTYYDRVKKGSCTILFLRKKENPEKSFCTVELKGTKIEQLRSAYNENAPAEAWEFMKKFTKELGKRIEKEKYGTPKAEKLREKTLQYLQEA